MRLRKKLMRGEQGQALVEFSFICVILLMLSGGVLDGVNIMRYRIALSGAVTEVANQVATVDMNAVSDICYDVININYLNNLGDGNTNYSCFPDDEVRGPVAAGMPYRYHVMGQADWDGVRTYVPVTVTLERDQVLFTPFGQLFFGDPGNRGKRNMKATAQIRVFLDNIRT